MGNQLSLSQFVIYFYIIKFSYLYLLLTTSPLVQEAMNLSHPKDLNSSHLSCNKNDAITRFAVHPLDNVNTMLLDRQDSYV